MALKDEIQSMKTIEQGVANNKVVNFAYTDKAYTDNDVNGVNVYDFNNENNIPTNNPDVIKVNSTVITKGYRAQASSITRMLVNHIFGRVSYNLNKTVDLFTSLLDKLGNAIGEPNGIATLDVDGRIPYSQLPETAVEYKGEWNAETNTPTLVDGTGDKGDMYYVSASGTQNLGSGEIVFLAGDRIIYNGTVWQRLSGGSVKKVNNIRPDDTGNVKIDDYISYTYIVDSNQKLLDWANNVAGNDYTSVLIKKGTWTSSVGVNLTTCGTKVVVGEAGSLLSFENVDEGLYYNVAPTSLEYYMLNVSVQFTKNSIGDAYGFFRCVNLTNCSSTGSHSGSGSGSGSDVYGFYSCNNLTNCAGTSTSSKGDGCGFVSCGKLTNCTGTGTGSSSSSSSNGQGFYSCNNLTNCTGTGNGTGLDTNSRGYGFHSCENLTNCAGTGESADYSYGFYSCSNLTNCTGTSNGTTIGSGFSDCSKLTNCTGTGTSTAFNAYGRGFNNCNNLTNCVGTGNGTSTGYGFNSCKNLTNCAGRGISSNDYGYGFYNCTGVSKCKAGGNCTSDVFSSTCFASLNQNMSYGCSDTPSGGFNNLTNPSS